MEERAACAHLKRRFEAAGFRIKENQTFDEHGVWFEMDGFDAERRVGYEYVTVEAGDGWDVDGHVIAALAERRRRGEIHVLIVDEEDAPDAASLDQAIDEFLAALPQRAAGAPADEPTSKIETHATPADEPTSRIEVQPTPADEPASKIEAQSAADEATSKAAPAATAEVADAAPVEELIEEPVEEPIEEIEPEPAAPAEAGPSAAAPANVAPARAAPARAAPAAKAAKATKPPPTPKAAKKKPARKPK